MAWQQDPYIIVIYLQNRFQLATVTASTIPELRRISSGTVQNHLCEQELHTRQPAVHPHTVLNLFILKITLCCQRQLSMTTSFLTVFFVVVVRMETTWYYHKVFILAKILPVSYFVCAVYTKYFFNC